MSVGPQQFPGRPVHPPLVVRAPIGGVVLAAVFVLGSIIGHMVDVFLRQSRYHSVQHTPPTPAPERPPARTAEPKARGGPIAQSTGGLASW